MNTDLVQDIFALLLDLGGIKEILMTENGTLEAELIDPDDEDIWE